MQPLQATEQGEHDHQCGRDEVVDQAEPCPRDGVVRGALVRGEADPIGEGGRDRVAMGGDVADLPHGEPGSQAGADRECQDEQRGECQGVQRGARARIGTEKIMSQQADTPPASALDDVQPDANRLLWIDMEMTGLDPERDRIIELAIVVTDSDLNILAESEAWVVHQPDAVLDAMAPLSELFGYSSAMRGLSQGRATCTMEPSTYGPAPESVLDGFV